MEFSQVTLVNWFKMIFLVISRSIMFVVRQVPTFMPWASNTSFSVVVSAGSGVGSGVAVSSGAGVDSSEEAGVLSDELDSVTMLSEGALAGCGLPLPHPMRDAISRLVMSNTAFFFIWYLLPNTFLCGTHMFHSNIECPKSQIKQGISLLNLQEK